MDKDTLIGTLIEANKRLALVVDEQKRLGGKLFGLSPQAEGNESNPEISVASLAHRLLNSIGALESELGRQHTAVGDSHPQQAASTRAVGY